MKWSITQLVAILDLEIAWCKEHPDPKLSPEFIDGFIKGIEQAQYILKGAENPKSEKVKNGK